MKRSSLRPVGKRRAAQRGARQRCVAVVRERSGGFCEVRSPAPGVCTGYGEHGHEILKSSQGGSRTDPANVLDSCDRCNSWLETAEGRRWGIASGKVIERRSLLAREA